jgi:hypothetical protein
MKPLDDPPTPLNYQGNLGAVGRLGRRKPFFRYLLIFPLIFVSLSVYIIYMLTHPYGPTRSTELIFVDAVESKPVAANCDIFRDGTPGSLDEGPGIVRGLHPSTGRDPKTVVDHNIWVEVRISATGYGTQIVRLDERSPARQVVQMVPTTQRMLPATTVGSIR